MIKKATSCYTFDGHDGNRSDEWLKLKPDYVEGNAQTLDVVIVGGFHGTGERQRRFKYSHFLLAVRSDEDAPEQSASKLVTEEDYAESPGSKLPKFMLTIGKVGTGFNYEMLKQINDDMAQNWTEVRACGGRRCDAACTRTAASPEGCFRGPLAYKRPPRLPRAAAAPLRRAPPRAPKSRCRHTLAPGSQPSPQRARSTATGRTPS